MAKETSEDEFSIRIILSHPSFSADKISGMLGVQPDHVAGVPASNGIVKTIWLKTLEQGHSEEQYDSVLRRVLIFLQKNRDSLNEFSRSGGESKITFSFDISLAEGKVLDATFHPKLLKELCDCSVKLGVEGWAGTLPH